MSEEAHGADVSHSAQLMVGRCSALVRVITDVMCRHDSTLERVRSYYGLSTTEGGTCGFVSMCRPDLRDAKCLM